MEKITTNEHLNLVGKVNMPDYDDDLEGIVSNEPKKNKYQTVKLHSLNIFPYYLIGKVVSKFDFEGVSKYLNGVGILIGPDIVLTVAHNLCHMNVNASNGSKKILMTKKVCYFAASNGDLNIFDPVKSIKTYVPPAYVTALKTENKEEQLYNDWGLIYLSAPIGDQIVLLMDIDKTNNLKVSDNLYQFFNVNNNLNVAKLSQQTRSEKVSIVGYTEFKATYKNNKAYKFLNNFKQINEKPPIKENNKSKIINDSTSNKVNTCLKKALNTLNINSNQGKLISELVQENEQDKKININISINTANPYPDSVTEGLITTSRYYNLNHKSFINEPSNNSIDYVIFNKEDYNKEFDSSDVDKLIMSESKGSLIGVDLEDSELDKIIKYQISTYKGQSGSPIFLRIKKLSEKNKTCKNSYFYHFVGLHSRRGPTADEHAFYESDKMNALTENLMTTDSNNICRANELIADSHFKHDAEKLKINYNNEIVKQNGLCEYNIALNITGEIISNIKDIMKKEFIEAKSNFSSMDNQCINYDTEGSEMGMSNRETLNSHQDLLISSEFVLTKIYLNDLMQLSGLFKKNVPLSVLFSFGAKIFNVPKEYILLRDINNSEFSRIHNYNFDHKKKYSEILPDCEITKKMSFEVMLNIKKYGEYISNNILQKFLENYDLEESQLKKDFEKKYMKPLFQDIFAEISSFETIQPTYGLLFKKIRKTILLNLEIMKKK